MHDGRFTEKPAVRVRSQSMHDGRFTEKPAVRVRSQSVYDGRFTEKQGVVEDKVEEKREVVEDPKKGGADIQGIVGLHHPYSMEGPLSKLHCEQWRRKMDEQIEKNRFKTYPLGNGASRD